MSSSSGDDFYLLTSGLNIEETKYLYQLSEMYGIGKIPLEDYHQQVLIGRIINCINKFDFKQAESFLIFLEGAVSGIDKFRDTPSSSTDVFLISGQNTINTRITSQSNEVNSDVLLNIDSSAVAVAIEKGILGKEEIQEIFQTIGTWLSKSEVQTKNRVENN